MTLKSITVKVPDYKPAFIVSSILLVVVSLVTVWISTPRPKVAAPASVKLDHLRALVDGHDFYTFDVELHHASHCEQCLRQPK